MTTQKHLHTQTDKHTRQDLLTTAALRAAVVKIDPKENSMEWTHRRNCRDVFQGTELDNQIVNPSFILEKS